ncbi:uncharacterized protein JCM10292_007671 [Rhodotorula paludigena]|uniref:uncharacterized protein n=1 Tax=Rhodotorula paludigena TaxID=86838 RepID=UPI003178D876
MSAPPSKFWPSVGSKWQHWSDLLLATQLAALRAGFNYVGRYWDPEVQLQNGCLGKATRVNAPKIKDNVRAIPNFMALTQFIDALAQYVSKTDQHIGSFPVRIGTSEDHKPAVLVLSDSSNAEPAALVSTAVDPSASASSRRIDTLRSDLAAARTELNSASAAVNELKANLTAAEKLVEVLRKRVEKREKRLERAVKKAERKKNKVKEGGRKKGKGKKEDAAKKEKGKAGRA